MTAFEQVYKAYKESEKNYFWDTWGIVMSPTTAVMLKIDDISPITIYCDAFEEVITIFGLVVIPCEVCPEDKVYIVDERLGRSILGDYVNAENIAKGG